MQPLAEIADALDQLPLDKRVHVLVGTIQVGRSTSPTLEDLVERSRYLLGFGFFEDADAGERFDPRQAARHVVFEETPVETEGRSELEGNRIGLGAETS